MNLLILLVIFFLAHQETVSSKRFKMLDNFIYQPLALIKKRTSFSSKLELAIPYKSTEHGMYAEYALNDAKDENGPLEEFKIACPANSQTEQALETKWREENNLPISAKLLFLDDYTDLYYICSLTVEPVIEKAPKTNKNGEVEYCGQSKAEIYNVGFKNMKIVSVYKICHSTAKGKGTLYSIHRIVSPSLLLKEAWEYYRKPISADEKFYENLLDKNNTFKQLLSKKQNIYPFVGGEDMPTKVWKTTTKFSFNYTSIDLNEDLLNGMVMVDNYIRLYSKKTNKPLTLYSGTHQTTVKKESNNPEPINAFWRIIIDDDGLATIIVTQDNKIVEGDYICHDSRVMIKKYKNGGCTYLCSVNGDLIQHLRLPHNEAMERWDLPPLKVTSLLNMTFPRTRETNSPSREVEQDELDKKSSKQINILDFFGNLTFRSALANADPDLASTVKVHEK